MGINIGPFPTRDTIDTLIGEPCMSTEQVREQIASFLCTTKPEVLCIRGHWGTGKTYSWQTSVMSLRNDTKAISLGQYAYVSLFGVNSINQLRAQILQNTVQRNQIGDLVTAETLKGTLGRFETAAKSGFMKLFGGLGDSAFDGVVTALSVFTNKQIVCIDDLERKGANLRAGDVLGYISYLKEERKCKIAILLNDKILQGEDEKQFSSYLEKVVDVNLRFAPSPAESAEIALADVEGSNELKELVRERVIKLGIDNVRVIRKLHRLVIQIEPHLRSYKRGVLSNVASSLILFGWCHYQPELAPSLRYLKDKNSMWDGVLDEGEENVDPIKESWNQAIREYGYSHTDEFDLVLMQGVADGYFVKESVERHASELHRREEAIEAAQQLQTAWDIFHGSFDDDAERLLGTFHACLMKNMQFHSLGDMISVVRICRELGDRKRGDEILNQYIEVHRQTPGAFDLNNLFQFGQEVPKDILDIFEKLREAQKPDLAVDEMLLRLETEAGNPDLTNKLAVAPVQEYIRALKGFHGDELGRVRRSLRQYLNVVNPSESWKTIMDRIGEALAVIEAESPLNAKRARTWGLIQRLEQLRQLPPDIAPPDAK